MRPGGIRPECHEPQASGDGKKPYLRRKHRIIQRWLARVPLGSTGDELEVRTPAAWEAMGHWRMPWWNRLRPRGR